MTTTLTQDAQQHVRIALTVAMALEDIKPKALEALVTDLINTPSLAHILATAGQYDKTRDTLASITYDPYGFRLEMCDATGMMCDGLAESEHPLVIEKTVHHVNDRCIARVVHEDTGSRTIWRLVLIQIDRSVGLFD